MTITVRLATIEDLGQLAPLFDAYRRFYGQPGDLALASAFLAERFRLRESVVLVAEAAPGGLVGFTQLYPAFSSVRAGRLFILNDLFVAPEVRRQGIARMLLVQAEAVAREQGAIGLTLSTAKTNEQAQALYASLGWVRDTEFLEYALTLQGAQP